MKLVHANRTSIGTYHQLDDVGRAQLRVCGRRWDGQDLPAERRLFDPFELCETPEEEQAIMASAANDDANLYGQSVSRCEVHVDGVHTYDLWLYRSDSGVMFRANTDEVVASIIQLRAQPERGDSSLREPLQELLRAMGFAS